MKSNITIVLCSLVLCLITSCSATNNMTIAITEPAMVHLPQQVKRIGVINRSLPAEGNKAFDKLDQILSAEGLNLDKKGAEKALSALVAELSMIKDLDEIKVIEPIEEVKSGLGVLPAALSWPLVESICADNGVDVLISLAFFDTDTKTDLKGTTLKLPNALGIKVDVPAHEVTLNTMVKCGWRMYYPQTKEVIDHQVYTKDMYFKGSGINPIKAVEAVANRNETVQQYSHNVGIAYAQRMVPKNARVSRVYFKKGTNNLKIAHRRAVAGDWEGAAELWARDLDNINVKKAGRAYYNMAISSEINGNLDQAIQMATKSYTDFKNNKAIDYLNELKFRVHQNRVLNDQLAR